MSNPLNWLSVLTFLLSVAGAGGGAVFISRHISQTLSTVQDRVIAAQREENKVLQEKIMALERELDTMRDTLSTIRVMLKRRGLVLRINGDFVTFVDTGVARETTVRIRKDELTNMATKDDGEETDGA